MNTTVYKLDGSPKTETVTLEPSVFEIKPNDHTIYLAVRAKLANTRQGTHKGKTRSEVRGGGRKPWRQKGRGTARAGSRRSPVWVGGGKAFPPTPHLYQMKLNKKVKQLARKSALSYKLLQERIRVIEPLTFEEPRTRLFVNFLKNLNLENEKVTFLLHDIDENVYLAARNLPNVYLLSAAQASTYDIMDCEYLLIDEKAVELVNEMLKTE
jgi:large subunit ribosomal protein L4